MYFGIIGEHEELVQHSLSYLHATDIVFVKKHIITFQTAFPGRLQTCASLIKRGNILSHEELEKQINSDTVGVADNKFGVHLKKQFFLIKRFKLVELIHTDIEIKTKGQEVVSLGENIYGLVQGYQNITLYETIDFNKPVGGMGIGMMPSKLALTLINIGIGQYEKIMKNEEGKVNNSHGLSSGGGTTKDPVINNLDSSLHSEGHVTSPTHPIANSPITIRDPFCGFGTTNFLANHLGYNTIGSDINPTQAKQNRKRRLTNSLSHQLTKSLFLKHDVTEPFKSPIFRHGNIIVSEGRLGHIVTNKTALNEVQLFSQDVESVYKKFFDNLTNLVRQKKELWSSLSGRRTYAKRDGGTEGEVCIITIPTRLKHEISISEEIQNHATSLGRTTTLLEKPYSRDKQLVGRQVLIANFQ